MGKQKITMTIDEKTFSAFKRMCNSRAMKVSSKVELMMQEFIETELAKSDAINPVDNNNSKKASKQPIKQVKNKHNNKIEQNIVNDENDAFSTRRSDEQ